jgi:hypothetical protein
VCSCGCGVCWVSLYTILFLLTVLADHLSAMLECSPEYPHRSADPPIEVPLDRRCHQSFVCVHSLLLLLGVTFYAIIPIRYVKV